MLDNKENMLDNKENMLDNKENMLDNKDNVLIFSIDDNKLNLTLNSKSYLIKNEDYLTYDDNMKNITFNNNDFNNKVVFNYLINENKLFLNIKYYNVKIDMYNCGYYFRNVIINSNNIIKELNITHSAKFSLSFYIPDNITVPFPINLYIDYMPNLKKINARGCNININENNNKIKFLTISKLNEYINKLKLIKKIIYYPVSLDEIDSYNYNFLEFDNAHSLTDFIKNQKHINKLIFNNASIILDTSFNKKINCFNTSLLFKDNFNLKYLKLNDGVNFELLQNNYFIDKLIIKNSSIDQIKNKFDNYICCNKVKYYQKIETKDNHCDLLNLLSIIKTNILILNLHIKFDIIKNVFMLNDIIYDIFKKNSYKNIIININNDNYKFNILKDDNKYIILDFDINNYHHNNADNGLYESIYNKIKYIMNK